eukprot:Partr_v1_DN28410_c0_g2_i1_m42098 putative SH3 domain containing, Ysc84-like 1 (S. cerevisiae)
MQRRLSDVNSPLPTNLSAECKKAAKTLHSFIKPNASKGPDSIIPANIIANAKGLAIMSVIKAGFIWSGRMGSGIVVARLPDGSWSAPSCIGTAGVGFGGQIGAEMTDYVIVLNTADAVKAFSMGGNVTLGGNLSVAAGPVGRTAEAAGAVGNSRLAAIFSYSKTKGLFAGVSLEGSVIIERKDANSDFYGRPMSAKDILGGGVERPSVAGDLYQALEQRGGGGSGSMGSPTAAYESPPIGGGASKSAPPGYPGAPNIPPRPGTDASLAVALYDFDQQRSGDLVFKKGDLIKIVKQTNSQNDWWVGSLNGQTGNFPANYVRLQQ